MSMDVAVGDLVPEWTVDGVDAARMKTMAALLRDPYPVHWDRAGNAAIGLPGRVINQGPLNLSYIVNMLLAWAGPTCVRRLTVSFAQPVLDGDCVVAGGRVTALEHLNHETLAHCDVWLARERTNVVSGTAIVVLQR
jgi:acyl dehydratase